MKWTFIIASALLIACSNGGNNDTANKNQQADSTKYTTINVSKSYVTLADGSVKENQQKATIMYSDKEFKVAFGSDSTWTFEIKDKQTKAEGTTFSIYDKKFKEIFISSGDLPMATFITLSESGNITLM